MQLIYSKRKQINRYQFGSGPRDRKGIQKNMRKGLRVMNITFTILIVVMVSCVYK